MEFIIMKNAAYLRSYINKSLFTVKTGTRQVVCSKTITVINSVDIMKDCKKSLHAEIKAVNNRGSLKMQYEASLYRLNHYITGGRHFHCVSGVLEDFSELETKSHLRLDHTCERM